MYIDQLYVVSFRLKPCHMFFCTGVLYDKYYLSDF